MLFHLTVQTEALRPGLQAPATLHTAPPQTRQRTCPLTGRWNHRPVHQQQVTPSARKLQEWGLCCCHWCTRLIAVDFSLVNDIALCSRWSNSNESCLICILSIVNYDVRDTVWTLMGLGSLTDFSNCKDELIWVMLLRTVGIISSFRFMFDTEDVNHLSPNHVPPPTPRRIIICSLRLSQFSCCKPP